MSRVVTHTRRRADGKVVTVHEHTRRGDAAGVEELRNERGKVRKPKAKRKVRKPNAGHAAKLARRAGTAQRRGKKATAGMLACLALGEMVAWFTLTSTGLLLAIIGGIIAALSVVLTN